MRTIRSPCQTGLRASRIVRREVAGGVATHAETLHNVLRSRIFGSRAGIAARNHSGLCSPSEQCPAHAFCLWRAASCSNELPACSPSPGAARTRRCLLTLSIPGRCQRRVPHTSGTVPFLRLQPAISRISNRNIFRENDTVFAIQRAALPSAVSLPFVFGNVRFRPIADIQAPRIVRSCGSFVHCRPFPLSRRLLPAGRLLRPCLRAGARPIFSTANASVGRS